MGYLPPEARTEELKDVAVDPKVRCQEVRIPSERGRKLAGIVLSKASSNGSDQNDRPEAVIMYLQGNAGSPLHRIPVFTTLLVSRPFTHPLPRSLRIVAVAPRSYWKSSGRATERGILEDYRATLDYISHRWTSSPIILYGHSLGGAAAICLLAQLAREEYQNVKGLVLENPFVSIPRMVKAMYPSPWTPYHHLGGFVWDKWDAVRAMREAGEEMVLGYLKRDTLVLTSEKDEVVPREMGQEIWEAAGGEVSGGKEPVVIKEALHEDAWMKNQWVAEMQRYVNGTLARNRSGM
ncbi:alpha/beta-hydrolase [Neolentinus lepideus HHB14362 ss-1]|uniref:Alpha/beta-hydrolase n=1 Tax=Neolentinus lepideus HHB14362 ss-1 TaxID=1314782 RepID=A0A165MRQ0_9AGAM|nr:alpha/beta-hydrolase [Neolentinus lepideus HHB14362 ss-1]